MGFCLREGQLVERNTGPTLRKWKEQPERKRWGDRSDYVAPGWHRRWPSLGLHYWKCHTSSAQTQRFLGYLSSPLQMDQPGFVPRLVLKPFCQPPIVESYHGHRGRVNYEAATSPINDGAETEQLQNSSFILISDSAAAAAASERCQSGSSPPFYHQVTARWAETWIFPSRNVCNHLRAGYNKVRTLWRYILIFMRIKWRFNKKQIRLCRLEKAPWFDGGMDSCRSNIPTFSSGAFRGLRFYWPLTSKFKSVDLWTQRPSWKPHIRHPLWSCRF